MGCEHRIINRKQQSHDHFNNIIRVDKINMIKK